MAMPSNLFLILLFLSTLHACDAHRLRFFESSSHVSRPEMRSISQGLRPDPSERILDKNISDKVSSMEIVGIEMLKGMKKHRKLVMELPVKDKEKVMKSEETEVGEDMVVMDYAQPHRKPPIHNEKP